MNELNDELNEPIDYRMTESIWWINSWMIERMYAWTNRSMHLTHFQMNKVTNNELTVSMILSMNE